MPTEPIITTGTITEIYSEKAFRATLPNGKTIIAHPHKNLAGQIPSIQPGTKVTLEMTPFDFEKGRISKIHP